MMRTASSAPAGGGNSTSGARAIASEKFGASAALPSNSTNHGWGSIPSHAWRATGSTSALQATPDTPACFST